MSTGGKLILMGICGSLILTPDGECQCMPKRLSLHLACTSVIPQLHNDQIKKQLEVEQVQHSLDIKKDVLEQRKMVSKCSETPGVNHSQYMLSSLVVVIKTDPVGS